MMKKLGSIGIMATIIGLNSVGNNSVQRVPQRIHEPMSEEEKMRKNGLKKFTYAGGDVYAINQANADKKAKKLGYSLTPFEDAGKI